MKRYQIALLFFTLGIFAITFLYGLIISRNDTEELNSQYDETVVKIFFASTKEDPRVLYCDLTYPVDRTISRLSNNEKSVLAEYTYMALVELIKGPVQHEKDNGYFTSLNGGVKVQSIII